MSHGQVEFYHLDCNVTLKGFKSLMILDYQYFLFSRIKYLCLWAHRYLVPPGSFIAAINLWIHSTGVTIAHQSTFSTLVCVSASWQTELCRENNALFFPLILAFKGYLRFLKILYIPYFQYLLNQEYSPCLFHHPQKI